MPKIEIAIPAIAKAAATANDTIDTATPRT
jgi:hypothetical protein